MTTSAPQWPGQDGTGQDLQDQREAEREPDHDASLRPAGRPVLRAVPNGAERRPQPAPAPAQTPTAPCPSGVPQPTEASRPIDVADPDAASDIEVADPDPEVVRGPVLPGVIAVPVGRGVEPRRPTGERRPAPGRRGRVVLRDSAERELRAARRRARATLPSPVTVTRTIALALLEVEAGCRSAAQLERIFSPELWEKLEYRIGRRGGPLPTGRSLMSVRCQEDAPGLADTVAVVQKGDLVRPVALRLDAADGRWTVTELRWWRNETDTATTPGRDGGSA